MSTGEERGQGAPDLLGDILRLAGQEGALQGHALRAFADALRARAALVIAERVAEAEAQAQTLERENAWRRETVARLEEENAWRRQSLAELEQSRHALEREAGWRRETAAELEKEVSWRRETAAGLEKEVSWRRETAAELEKEVSWRRETAAGLEKEVSWRREAAAELEKEVGWRREMQARLAQEGQRLRTMVETADQGHKNLLDHHRAVLARVATELSAVASMPAWRIGRTRRRLLALAQLLRGEVP
jgi:hypothetical protein